MSLSCTGESRPWQRAMSLVSSFSRSLLALRALVFPCARASAVTPLCALSCSRRIFTWTKHRRRHRAGTGQGNVIHPRARQTSSSSVDSVQVRSYGLLSFRGMATRIPEQVEGCRRLRCTQGCSLPAYLFFSGCSQRCDLGLVLFLHSQENAVSRHNVQALHYCIRALQIRVPCLQYPSTSASRSHLQVVYHGRGLTRLIGGILASALSSSSSVLSS